MKRVEELNPNINGHNLYSEWTLESNKIQDKIIRFNFSNFIQQYSLSTLVKFGRECLFAYFMWVHVG